MHRYRILPFAVAAGVFALGSLAAEDAQAACSVSLTTPTNGYTAIQTPLFKWSGACAQYRTHFSPSGTFAGDVTTTPWQTAKQYSMSESVWDDHQMTDWVTRVYWKVEGDDGAGAFTNTAARFVNMDPNIDDDAFSVSQGDCDDQDSNVFPTSPELCNGTDDDCDGVPDDGLVSTTWYYDDDGDGYGTPDVTSISCGGAPADFVANADDCDDTNSGVYPGAPDVCNALDDDCDGTVDEGFPLITLYRDKDGDTFGDPGGQVDTCVALEGYVFDNTDCDDDLADVNPGVAEICDNEIDDNCNGTDDGCSFGGMTLLGEADVVVRGQRNSYLGAWQEHKIGDLNGDGQADLVVGAPAGSYGRNVGVEYVFYGPITDDLRLSDADFRIVGDYSGRQLGVSSEVVGDIDGDGNNDLAVGWYGGSYQGGVSLFLGPFDGTTLRLSDADATFEGWTAADYAWTMEGLGDLDGDGYDDMAVMAYGYDDYGSSNDGWVDIWYGPVYGDFFFGMGDVSYYGYGGDYAGTTVRTGDVDGDGERDLLITRGYGDDWNEYGQGGYDLAGWHVCYGPNLWGGYLAEECTDELIGDTGYYGEAWQEASTVADMNGDGMDDLVIGRASGGDGSGEAHICLGPIDGKRVTSSCEVHFSRDDHSLYFGAKVQVGDVNADGVPDLLVGDSHRSYWDTYQGTIWTYFGPFDGNGETISTIEADASFVGESSEDYMGLSFDVADMNGDGRDDVVSISAYSDRYGTNAGEIDIFFAHGL